MKKSIKEERKEAIEQSVEKWEAIEESIHHDEQNPCGLCSYIKVHRGTICPLKGKRCGASSECTKEWQDVREAVQKMLRKLWELEEEDD